VVIGYKTDFVGQLKKTIIEGIRNEWYILERPAMMDIFERKSTSSESTIPANDDELEIMGSNILLLRKIEEN
jgi:hypothetical protein